MQLSLYFDGACSPNPGRGGCGAVVYRKQGKKPALEMLRESCSLGELVTNNVAEYSGLILGLQSILRKLRKRDELGASCRPNEVMIDVYGDSELVVNQMMGDYKVHNCRLEILHNVAQGLVSKFASARFHHIRRELNAESDDLARRAVQGDSTTEEEQRLIFYPNRCGHTRARINDIRTNASDDRGAAMLMPHILIDAAYLVSLPTFNGKCLRSLELSPYRMCTEGSLVLGVLHQRHFHLDIMDFDYPDDVNIHCVVKDAIVVDNLPVPLHISYAHPKIGGPIGYIDFRHSLSADLFPGEYAQHPYWKPGKISIPSYIGVRETPAIR